MGIENEQQLEQDQADREMVALAVLYLWTARGEWDKTEFYLIDEEGFNQDFLDKYRTQITKLAQDLPSIIGSHVRMEL